MNDTGPLICELVRRRFSEVIGFDSEVACWTDPNLGHTSFGCGWKENGVKHGVSFRITRETILQVRDPLFIVDRLVSKMAMVVCANSDHTVQGNQGLLVCICGKREYEAWEAPLYWRHRCV